MLRSILFYFFKILRWFLPKNELFVFICAVSFGVLLIFYRDVNNINQLPFNLELTYLATLIDTRFHRPLLIGMVMLIYMSITCINGSYKKPAVMDSYYYLGFLFTLLSMIAIFYFYSVEKRNDNDISDLISDNGIALSSTVVGMTIRIIIRMIIFKNKTYEDKVEFKFPNQEEISAYIKLIESMRSMGDGVKEIANLAKEASNTVEPMQSFKSTIEQVKSEIILADDAFLEHIKNVETNREANAKSLTALKAELEATKSLVISADGSLLSDTTKLYEAIAAKITEIDNDTAQLKTTHDTLLKLYSELTDSISQNMRKRATNE